MTPMGYVPYDTFEEFAEASVLSVSDVSFATTSTTASNAVPPEPIRMCAFAVTATVKLVLTPVTTVHPDVVVTVPDCVLT